MTQSGQSALVTGLIQRRDGIIEAFIRRVRVHSPNGQLPRSVLEDSLPALLDQLARQLAQPARASLEDVALPAAVEHGEQRQRTGIELREMVREYGILQHVISIELETQGIEVNPRELRALHNHLNSAVADAVAAFVAEAEQMRTTLMQVQGNLQANQRRLQMITEQTPQLMWTARPDGYTDWYNSRWYEYTGLTEVECASPWGWLEAIHPDDREKSRANWSGAVQSGLLFETEYRIRRADGIYRWFLGRALPVRDEAGQLIQWFGSSTDVDDQKHTEERLRAATAESERLHNLKDEFLATMSHELRTPLQSILGWARLLRVGRVDQVKSEKALETIERNAKAQSQLIEDLLDVSRIVSGRATLNLERMDVDTILTAALDTIQPVARAKGVRIRPKVERDLGTLTVDPDRVQQVLWNLLSNAVKFTEPGGAVTLTARPQAAGLEIEVSDNGRGIAPEFLPLVFERFLQEKAGPGRTHGGLGLGLAIVRHLVELHGGTIRVHSEGEGKGATFYVFLPDRESTSPTVPTAALRKRSDPVFPAATALSGLRVLVVDDEPDSLDLVSTIVQEHGAEVSRAASASEAFSLLQQIRVDLIVSDIAMPDEDGYSLIKRIRSRTDLRSLPAVALTAYASPADQWLALESGYDDHLSKPVEPANLVARLARLAQKD